jgi:hypothetical protein
VVYKTQLWAVLIYISRNLSLNGVRIVKSRRLYNVRGIKLGCGRKMINAEFLFGGKGAVYKTSTCEME